MRNVLGDPTIILLTGPEPTAVDVLCAELARHAPGAAVTRVGPATMGDDVVAIRAAHDEGRVAVVAAPPYLTFLDALAIALAPRDISVLRLTGAVDDPHLAGLGGVVDAGTPESRLRQALELLASGRAHEFHRRAGRIIPVDADGRVLLLEGFVPGREDEPFWCAIGGGIEPGETPQEAALRELQEEVGITVPTAAVRELRSVLAEFDHSGLRFIQEQAYFAARVDSALELTLEGMEEQERPTMLQAAWVDPADIGGSLPAPEHLPPICREAVAALTSSRRA